MKTYIIIVTYNGMPWLSKCLESCKDYHVILVDNASNDGTVGFVKEHYKDVIILPQNENLGFGAANNIGISYALGQGAEHVFLLNQDAYLVDDALAKLVAFQEANTAYGILSPIHLNANKDKLDTGFANYVNFGNNPYFVSDAVLQDTMQPVYEVPFVNAAGWLISKACLECVGGFDPLFFHYGEDDNYCQRVLYHGFKIGIVPTAFMVHDREENQNMPLEPYTDEYLKYKERHYKVKLANVNNDNYLEEFSEVMNRLKKEIAKSILAINFKKLKSIKAEMKCVNVLRKKLIYSQTKNRTQGAHYLEL